MYGLMVRWGLLCVCDSEVVVILSVGVMVKWGL